MKKLTALLLALTLCLFSFGALASEVQIPESAQSFDLSVTVPEGYTAGETSMLGEMSINEFIPDDPATKPDLTLVIAYSEEYEGLSMTKDMSDEDIKALYDLIDDGYSSDSYTVGTTDDGWKYLQLIDNEKENGYAVFLMIHNGYFIEVAATFEDFRPLTEADTGDAIKLLDSYVITDM